MICRETNQEMQLKFQELSTLYQAASVERDRLSELVKVLEKRQVLLCGEICFIHIHLAKFFCLPLLTCSVGALNVPYSKVRELAVCRNDAFRKFCRFNRWEFLKLVKYFCGVIDFSHYYDIQRWRFLSGIGKKNLHT